MKRLIFCAMLFLASTALCAQQPAPKTGQRFQLIATTISDASAPENLHHVVFLLDTETGQVWRYFELAGGPSDLKPQDRYTSPSEPASTITAISPGRLVPVPKIELSGKPVSQ